MEGNGTWRAKVAMVVLRFCRVGYCFTRQLEELDCVSDGPNSVVLPGAEVVVTPLEWQAWKEDLECHPDRAWVEWIVKGIQSGFRVGHD